MLDSKLIRSVVKHTLLVCLSLLLSLRAVVNRQSDRDWNRDCGQGPTACHDADLR